MASAVTDLTVASLSLAKKFVITRAIVTGIELHWRQLMNLCKSIQASAIACEVVNAARFSLNIWQYR